MTGTMLRLLFRDYPGTGEASAKVVGDCLEVEYNDYMVMTDFENGSFCR